MTATLVLLLVLILVLGGCATRKLESCLTTFMMLGPGTVTIDCRSKAQLPQ